MKQHTRRNDSHIDGSSGQFSYRACIFGIIMGFYVTVINLSGDEDRRQDMKKVTLTGTRP